MEQIFHAFATVIAGVTACVLYFYASNLILDRLCLSGGPHAGRNIRWASAVRPWLFLGPAIALLAVYLVLPVLNSVALSFLDAAGREPVGMANYAWLLSDDKFTESFRNSMLWLVVVPTATTFLGLVTAALTDRIRWGSLARSLIFMPMAISFAGASVIWKFIYEYRPEQVEQIGLLNAIVVALGGEPQAWITLPFWNSFLLMAILIWIQTGFAMVILSAALRGIAHETEEAAVLDGATALQIFLRIKVPQIWGTIAVVWTTITIGVLKVFDIVLVMTNGQWGSQVLANLMFDWMFRGNDAGRASTIALVIMLLVAPIMIWNVHRARKSV